MKKRLGLVLALAMVLSFVVAVPASAAEGEFTIHAKSDFATPMLWAWGDAGNVFAAWPGEALTADPDNAGWFFYSVPDTTTAAIISDGAGVQTVDCVIEPKEVWITLGEAGSDGKLAADAVYEAPEGFVVAGATDAAATEDAAAEETTETEVPKTGVADLMYVYMGLAGLSGAGFVAAKKRKNA